MRGKALHSAVFLDEPRRVRLELRQRPAEYDVHFRVRGSELICPFRNAAACNAVGLPSATTPRDTYVAVLRTKSAKTVGTKQMLHTVLSSVQYNIDIPAV